MNDENTIIDENIIVLRNVLGPDIKAYIQPCKDENGLYPEHIRRVDANGEMILTEADKARIEELIPEDHIVTIYSGKVFDLKKKRDKAEWEAIKHCDIIAQDLYEKDKYGRNKIHGDMYGDKDYKHSYDNDFNARYGPAEFHIEKPELTSRIAIDKIKTLHKAQKYILDDIRGFEGHKRMCRILGRGMEGSTPNSVLEFLLNTAKESPNKIISLYESSTAGLHFMMLEALDKGIIRKENGSFVYGNTVIGVTREGVISWLEDSRNNEVVKNIKRELSNISDVPEELYDDNTIEDSLQQEIDLSDKFKPKAKGKK